MVQASLFSGIDGFGYAAHEMGWHNLFNCENDSFCKSILKYSFPSTIQYDDIRKTKFSIHRGAVDVLTGGFPCQPFSLAGKRKGTADSRYLWKEMLRAIREIQPSWVIGENVYGLLSQDGGMAFEQVCLDLENEGYEVWTYLLPAAGVGAPHERYRTFIIAHTNSNKCNAGQIISKQSWETIAPGNGISDVSYSNGERCQQQYIPTVPNKPRQLDFRYYEASANTTSIGWYERHCYTEASNLTQDFPNWRNFPTQSPICFGDDGLPAKLDGITFSRYRRESIKAAGNAVVPQVVLQLYKAIEEMNATSLV